MNVQIERLEGHNARLKVEVPQERYSQAREATIKNLSGRINIPGFRKGKVPASMVVKYVGEAYIVEEVVEKLGQDVYREALQITSVEPAAPGSMEDFKLEPAIEFIYTVPLAPEVSLSEDYRDIRFEYHEPTIDDKEVEAELRELQREFAETVESTEPAAVGDRITADLHSFFVAADTDASSSDTDVHEREEEPYVHRHGAILDLNEGLDEPFVPGFTAQMVGVRPGETRTFRITMPESGEQAIPDLAGKTIEFVVSVQKIEKVTLPPIDDALAAKVSERYGWENLGEDDGESLGEAVERLADDVPAEATRPEDSGEGAETIPAQVAPAQEIEAADDAPEPRPPLTLEQVRVRVRQMIEQRSQQQAREEFANKVLEHVIGGSQVTFNQASLDAEVEDMIEDFKSRLEQNRLSLDLYLKSTGKSLDQIKAEYRAPAETRLRRSLAVREFATRERILVTQDDLTDRLMTVFSELGVASARQLGLLNNEEFAASMINNLMSQKIEERAIAIGRGEAPDLNAAPAEPAIAAELADEAAAEPSAAKETGSDQ